MHAGMTLFEIRKACRLARPSRLCLHLVYGNLLVFEQPVMDKDHDRVY
jgi:hypothetical protein